jgi:putative nucleotidyltransferase with HDIG domain
MSQARWAEDTARALLEPALPRRWAHTQSVADRARDLAPILGADADLLTAAAWLHDIGYAPELRGTGFHPLDGARYLRDAGASRTLCRLVAHHSYAVIEAAERGMARLLLKEFAPLPGQLLDSLTYCDMVTGPDGQRVSVEYRLAEAGARYGPDDPVSRSLSRAAPMLTAAVARVAGQLAVAGSELGPVRGRLAPALVLAG